MRVELRDRDGEVTRVRIFIGEKQFDITEKFGELDVLASGKLSITPGVTNVIQLDCEQQ